MLTLLKAQLDEITSHAREANPQECCGLIGGASEGRLQTVYRLRNVAAEPLVTYEAAPEELFFSQTKMRDRGEELLRLYHLHPLSSEPKILYTELLFAL